MTGSVTGPQPGFVVGVLTALFMFGVAFNEFVGWAQRRGYDEGVTAFEVIAGVLVTLLGASALLWGRVFTAESLLLLIGCFAASGAPMALGAWGRYAAARAHGQDTYRRDRS